MVDTSTLGTVEAVQLTLADPEGDDFSPAVIERMLTAARRIVGAKASASSDGELLEEAIIALAALKTFNAAPAATRKSAANNTKEWDVEGMHEHLRRQYEETLQQAIGFVFEAY